MKMKKSISILLLLGPVLLLTNNTSLKSSDLPSHMEEIKIDKIYRQKIFKTVKDKMMELYLYPEKAKKMLEKVEDKMKKGEYRKINSLSNFVSQLTEDMLSVYPDGHLRIEELKKTQLERRITDNQKTWWDRRTKEAQYHNFYFRKVEWLPGNIGYLDYRRLEYASLSGPTATAVMNFFSFSDALIIDLRKNPGGRGDIVQLILSYFFNGERIHYETKINRGKKRREQIWTIPTVPGRLLKDIPIYILTSRQTGSAAEAFAYCLKHLKRATIIGERTAGAAHTTHRHIFPNLKIALYIPDGTAISPLTGKDWEGTGVIPNIKTKPAQALNVAYQHALNKLLIKETDKVKIFRLNWIKKEIESKIKPIHLSLADLKKYSGTYGPRIIYLKDDVLHYRREGREPFPLLPLGKNLFKVKGIEYFRIKFYRDSKGNITKLEGVYDDGSKEINQRNEPKQHNIE